MLSIATLRDVVPLPPRAHSAAEHRTLVLDLKNRKTVEPDKRHFIRNGAVNSVERTLRPNI